MLLRPRERKVEQQVLRLEFEPLARIHRHRHVNRPSCDRRAHVGGIREAQLEKAQHAGTPLIVDLGAIVQIVEEGACLGVEPDMPDPLAIHDLMIS